MRKKGHEQSLLEVLFNLDGIIVLIKTLEAPENPLLKALDVLKCVLWQMSILLVLKQNLQSITKLWQKKSFNSEKTKSNLVTPGN